MSNEETIALLIDLEHQRCQAMVDADLLKLRALLHPELIHVHAKGQVDGLESYLATGGVKVHYRRVERFDLHVKVMGDSALMTGRQMLEAERKDGSGDVYIDSRVIQVWVKEGSTWVQLAFQTTPTEMRSP